MTRIVIADSKYHNGGENPICLTVMIQRDEEEREAKRDELKKFKIKSSSCSRKLKSSQEVLQAKVKVKMIRRRSLRRWTTEVTFSTSFSAFYFFLPFYGILCTYHSLALFCTIFYDNSVSFDLSFPTL